MIDLARVRLVVAKAEQIKALIRSHAEGDDSRFYAIAMQVAAHAARTGHGKFAQELRQLVDEAKGLGKSLSIPRSRPVPLVQPRGELAGLLTVGYPDVRVADMYLDESVRKKIDRVLVEQRQRERIREHGLTPLLKLLMVGPPGTGKTMTASVLAGELGLPLFTIQLHGLITKYMGETAAKLRLIFDAVQQTRGVYFFDEFDALGGDRSAKNDVGEIRRVLNSFLQFLEQDESDSLLMAATNHPELLDRALFRRFDTVIEHTLPSRPIAEQLMKARLSLFDVSHVDWASVAVAAAELSHADITRACEYVAKNAILSRTTVVSTMELADALNDRRGT